MALQEELVVVAGRQCHIVCGTDAPLCMVVKPLGPFEWRCLMEECLLTEQLAAIPFVMVAFDMDNLDSFRQPDWATRDFVVEQLMPEMRHRFDNIPVVLGGYSLRGLFALWCSTTGSCCDAVAAASPSLWAEWWADYADCHPPLSQYVYLSVGDTEDKTRKYPFCRMGECLRQQHGRNLISHPSGNCTLEWNAGGHFDHIELRKAKGWAWCINALLKKS